MSSAILSCWFMAYSSDNIISEDARYLQAYLRSNDVNLLYCVAMLNRLLKIIYIIFFIGYF
ncbi:protein of unknown function [Enterobacter cancerogenus]|nr:protein of unknown function [Enterobacter cancerogenus]